jgi:pilus assembly protein CpaB
MKNKRRITGIIAAIALATIGTVALVGYVQSARDDAVAAEALVDLYVVDALVPKGAPAETIRASVSLAQVPARLEQPGAISDLDELGDNVAATDLQPGDQLLAARVVPKDEVSEDVRDKVQVAALLTPERAVGGSLQKGDLVGVYLSFDPFTLDAAGQRTDGIDGTDTVDGADAVQAADPSASTVPAESSDDQRKSPNVTRLEFQHVLVTNVQTTNDPIVAEESADTDASTPPVVQVSGAQYVVTLALTPEQSERFVFATEFGHVWLSKDPATVSDDGTRLVTLGNVFTVVP